MNWLAGRYVTPRPRGGAAFAGGRTPSGPLERIVKYIPAEVVAIYTAVIGVLASVGNVPRNAVLVLAAAGLAAVVALAWKAPDAAVRRAHLIVSPLAFLAWAYPVSAPFLGDWFIGYVSAVAQGVILLLGLVIDPQEGE